MHNGFYQKVDQQTSVFSALKIYRISVPLPVPPAPKRKKLFVFIKEFNLLYLLRIFLQNPKYIKAEGLHTNTRFGRK
jgi:hypothetical protein